MNTVQTLYSCLDWTTWAEPGSSVIPGVPLWLACLGMIGIILGSHLFFFQNSPGLKFNWRFDLLKIPGLGKLVKHPAFPFFVQSFSIILFLIIILAGLFANQRNNIAPVLTWTWWWALLIFLVLIAGKFFCMICPFEGLVSLLTSFSVFSRKNKVNLGFELSPKLRNLYPALILFIILTWFELGYEITNSGVMTACMGFAFLFLACIFAIFFKKRSFCRYICPIGSISGLYSMVSPVELRVRESSVCGDCATKDCLMGNDSTRGCELYLNPAKLSSNIYCTMCTECVRSCPTENVSIFLRPFGKDLDQTRRFKKDEAIMILTLLALTTFHGITMTGYWKSLVNFVKLETGLSNTVSFSLLMILIVLLQISVYGLAILASTAFTSSKSKFLHLFKAFSYSVLPIALFYHLAHNSMHFLGEALNLLPLLADPFSLGWNLFGLANVSPGTLLSPTMIGIIQVVLIVIGHIYSVYLADKFSKKVFFEREKQVKAMLPLILVMVFYSSLSMFLIASPMDMRSAF